MRRTYELCVMYPYERKSYSVHTLEELLYYLHIGLLHIASGSLGNSTVCTLASMHTTSIHTSYA